MYTFKSCVLRLEPSKQVMKLNVAATATTQVTEVRWVGEKRETQGEDEVEKRERKMRWRERERSTRGR